MQNLKSFLKSEYFYWALNTKILIEHCASIKIAKICYEISFKWKLM